jgi:hypothetical protein
MQTSSSLRRGLRALWREERGVVMALVLLVMTLLLGVGATALYSGYTNFQISTNLKLASQAKAQAEANVNEAIYRLSRQETDADAVAPDLTDPTWQVEINFSSGDTDASDGVISTIQDASDWPEYVPDDPVIARFKRPDAVAAPNDVLFYDPQQNPKFVTYTLPNIAIPASAHPVIQILATALDGRDAERQILAEVVQTTTSAPEAPLSSGVDVNLNGSGFIDGVNHHHLIYITAAGGVGGIYGDASNGSESTDSYPGGNAVPRDSPDDNLNTGNRHGVANATLGATTYSSYPRLFNMQISNTSTTPAWIGVTQGASTGTWTGTNTGYASAVALSNNGVGGPTVTNDQPPVGNVWTRGVFSWRVNNNTTNLTATIPAAGTYTNCSPGTTPGLVCRPTSLTHGADSFSGSQHFPFFQEFLGLDDAAYENLLDQADTTKADLDAGDPPLGFTYIVGNYTFNNSTASPGTNDFGLMYVTGNLTINGSQVFKGLIYIDGSLSVAGNPTILGAIMVRGSTQITAGTGNMTLLYSRKAAELGIQAGHPWRTLSWTDTAMQ